ncbi:MAG: excinuclease ABC subunit C [Erysipelothrix sp.]|nr:excinuclease ABC subunit C [Erysipelothrix sp.]
MKNNIKIKITNLPDQPGCYLMKDKDGLIIYVGKAINLKSRVSSYFTGAHDYKVTKMVSLIADFDYIVTSSEKEALILELNLIKKHQPRFNVIFMDDKVYPYIKITDEEWPRLVISRNREKDKNAKIFGPYPDSSAARKMINLLGRLYPIRKCNVMPKKACLYYHLGQCLGMCEFEVDKQVYQDMLNDVEKILKGDTKKLLKANIDKQKKYIEEMKFELAADVQKIINAINHISDSQQVQTNNPEHNFDVFNYYVFNGYISIVLIQIRNGKVINQKKHFSALYQKPQDALVTYINQYYSLIPLVKEIIVPFKSETDLYTDNIKDLIFKPQRGGKVRYIEMSENNAKHHLEDQFSLINTLPEKISLATKQLDELLDKTIFSIEMFDISHISGTNTVAGMVYFNEGLPDKKEYRIFRLDDHNSDTKSMQEVIYRRYFRLLKEKQPFPDLIIVDGGIAQVNVAKEVITSLGLDLEVVGLVKDQFHNTRAIVTFNNIELEVDKESELFFFLSRMQDEVHRFAINYHKKLRSKSQTRSILDDIDGIGEARKQALLAKFKTINAIKKATINDLFEVVPLRIAQNIIDFFED